MPHAFAEIIAQLERQRSAIDNALAALRDIDGVAPETQSAPATAKRRGRPPAKRADERSTAAPVAQSVPATKKRGMSPEGKARLVAALKARWAAKKAAEGAPAKKAGPATNKGGMTEQGRARLAEAMRRRWAVKRTAGQAKKRGRKAA